MQIDYEAISKKNELELGTKLKSRRTQISLYADPTHFIYELLQNADDHGATNITFRLTHDRLVVEHNGTERFAEKHVAAISSFEDSTSEDELLKTGKFGLGFKSVFAFTATPRVFCGNANFEIHDLYRLRSMAKPEDLDITLTRFELPFNHLEVQPEFIFEEHMKSPEMAIEIIHGKFEALEDITLLFTRNLTSISVTAEDARYSWKRIPNRDGTVTIKSPNATATFRLRERHIEWQGKRHRPVQIAIRLDENGSPIPSDEHLVVTFPTSISTGMGIILNGPYRTTPARETVGEGDDFNEFLVEQSADLLAEMIREERNAKRLTLKFLEILPIDSSRADCPDFFSPIHTRIRKLLVDEPVLPTAKGKYVAGKHARIARGQYLADLISDDQLTALFKSPQALHWLSKDVTETNTPSLYRALAGSGRNIYQRVTDGLVEGIVIRPEVLFAKLTTEFIGSQPPRWLCKLYAALHKHASADAKTAAALRPIVRLSTRKHVPLLTNGRPSAYLPSKATTKYETVEPKVLKSKVARAYFTSSGYRQPDLSAEVFEKVLPRYRKGDPGVLFKTHLLHLRKILKVSKDAKVAAHLLQQLRSMRIVYCFNAHTKEERYCQASDVYVWDQGLESYFSGNPNAWFVSREYGKVADGGSFLELFRHLGVMSEVPRELCGAGSYSRHWHGDHERGIAGFHPHWNLDGLEFATENPTLNASAFIWNYLLPRFENRICGKVQSSRRQDFPAHYTTEQHKVSPGGVILRERAWVPDAAGEFRTGKEIGTLDLLHDSLEKDQDVLALLDEGASSKKAEAAKALGISLDDAAFINKFKDEYLKWKAEMAAVRVPDSDNEDRFIDWLAAQSRATDRRKQKILKTSTEADRRRSESRQRMQRVNQISTEEVLLYLRSYYSRDDRFRCQMMTEGDSDLHEMPFWNSADQMYSGKEELFNRQMAQLLPDALPESKELNLFLCPNCAAIYTKFIAVKPEQQLRLFEWVRSNAFETTFSLDCSLSGKQSNRILHFHPKHLDDIRSVDGVFDASCESDSEGEV